MAKFKFRTVEIDKRALRAKWSRKAGPSPSKKGTGLEVLIELGKITGIGKRWRNYLLKKEIERLTPEIDRKMPKKGGVLLYAHTRSWKVPGELGTNPSFMGAGIAGTGKTPKEAWRKFHARPRLFQGVSRGSQVGTDFIWATRIKKASSKADQTSLPPIFNRKKPIGVQNDVSGVKFIKPPSSLQSNKKFHQVKVGDNLTKIARRYNTTVDAIYRANRKTIGPNKNFIRVGDRFTIPSASSGPSSSFTFRPPKPFGFSGSSHHSTTQRPYTVRPGDNLTKIARRYNTTVDAIYRVNRKTIGPNKNLIRVGDQFMIPMRHDRSPTSSTFRLAQQFRPAGSRPNLPPKPYYTVRPGDNLTKIARRYNTTADAIYRANRKTIGNNKNLIRPGQRLSISFLR